MRQSTETVALGDVALVPGDGENGHHAHKPTNVEHGQVSSRGPYM